MNAAQLKGFISSISVSVRGSLSLTFDHGATKEERIADEQYNPPKPTDSVGVSEQKELALEQCAAEEHSSGRVTSKSSAACTLYPAGFWPSNWCDPVHTEDGGDAVHSLMPQQGIEALRVELDALTLKTELHSHATTLLAWLSCPR